MNKLTLTPLALALTTALFSQSAMAVSNAEFKRLQAQVNELASQADKSGSSSSKTTVGGYGEVHYNNLTTTQDGSADSTKRKMDIHRYVLFVGQEFNNKMRLFSEFEIEHGLAGEGQQHGEVEVEQAYVEIDINKNMKTRAGVMLVPVGILNETHEPPTFYGVERNPVEKRIVPATWWSAGIGLMGTTNSGISYDLMVSEGLNLDDSGAMNDIRSGRQKSSKAEMNDAAVTARVKYTGVAGLEVAATVRYETDLMQGKAPDAAPGILFETHAVYNIADVTVKALYAQWDISGDLAKTSKQDGQSGFYLEPSYKINDNWGAFARYNNWNKTTESTNEETQIDVGFNYWPADDIVFKADYQMYSKNNSTNKKTDGFNLGVGYQF